MKRIKHALAHCRTEVHKKLLLAAADAALTAGEIIGSLYEKPHDIRMKGAIDLVTEADLAAEKAILAGLKKDFPDIDFLAEESSGTLDLQQEDRKCWIIDPLDGTTNFAHGIPIFGTSIALWNHGVVEVGVIYCPMQDELFVATNGGGAWLGDRRLRVTETGTLLQALVATGFPYDIHKHLHRILHQIEALLPSVRDIRRCGAAAVDLAYLACGRLDAFWEADLKPWDTAAAMLLVTEAGGVLSDFNGKKFSPFHPEIIASNPLLHRQFVDLLR